MSVYLYRYSYTDAQRYGELGEWLASHTENIHCRDAIDKMVSERFTGNILPSEIIKNACDEYGIDRVGWVLANTVAENDYDGRYRTDTKEWARTAYYLPDDGMNADFELHSHPELINGLVGQYRKYLSEELSILTKEACLPNSNAEDYTNKLLIMRSEALADPYKKGEFQYFYANCGFGCNPRASGRKIFGFFVADGERAQFERSDFLGIADSDQCPDWVNEKIAKHFQGQQNTETGGMTLS